MTGIVDNNMNPPSPKQIMLTGPVNAIGQGPVASKFYHHFVVHLGFDVVLEKTRGRRY